MEVDVEIINLVFVISLSFLAISLIVFLFYFIPVLIQLKKAIESINGITNIFKNYLEEINSKISSAGQRISKLGGFVQGIFDLITEAITKIISKEKR